MTKIASSAPTPAPRKLEMIFYNTLPSEKAAGLKFVLWEILIPPVLADDQPTIKHDWGFAYWDGREWEKLETPKDWHAVVCYWANTLDPVLLLKEPSKIIKL